MPLDPCPPLIRRRFDYFWQRYPKKRSKGDAWRRFQQIKPNGMLFRQMIEGLTRCTQSDQWRKDGGRYVPYPATWLNAAGWLDEFEESAPVASLYDAQKSRDRVPGIF